MIDRERRRILRLGLASLPALAAGCGWSGGPILGPKLQTISRVNDAVGEWLLSERLAPQYSVDARSSDFPPYFISDAMPVLDADRQKDWAFVVGGLVKRPLRLSLDDLRALPRITYTVKHFCVEGWTAIGTWTGVPVSTIATLAEPLEQARYLRFDSFDAGYANGWDLKSAMHPQTILAYAYNDRDLEAGHGAPLRLYSPVKLGYKLTKYLTSMTYTHDQPGGYWEDQGYPWFAGI